MYPENPLLTTSALLCSPSATMAPHRPSAEKENWVRESPRRRTRGKDPEEEEEEEDGVEAMAERRPDLAEALARGGGDVKIGIRSDAATLTATTKVVDNHDTKGKNSSDEHSSGSSFNNISHEGKKNICHQQQ